MESCYGFRTEKTSIGCSANRSQHGRHKYQTTSRTKNQTLDEPHCVLAQWGANKSGWAREGEREREKNPMETGELWYLWLLWSISLVLQQWPLQCGNSVSTLKIATEGNPWRQSGWNRTQNSGDWMDVWPSRGRHWKDRPAAWLHQGSS